MWFKKPAQWLGIKFRKRINYTFCYSIRILLIQWERTPPKNFEAWIMDSFFIQPICCVASVKPSESQTQRVNTTQGSRIVVCLDILQRGCLPPQRAFPNGFNSTQLKSTHTCASETCLLLALYSFINFPPYILYSQIFRAESFLGFHL